MKTVMFHIFAAAATLTAFPAVAETGTPRLTRVAFAAVAPREVAVQRRINALREQLGQLELQRLVDRVSADRTAAPAIEFARVGPR